MKLLKVTYLKCDLRFLDDYIEEILEEKKKLEEQKKEGVPLDKEEPPVSHRLVVDKNR
jgi:hypothetical protein